MECSDFAGKHAKLLILELRKVHDDPIGAFFITLPATLPSNQLQAVN